MLQLAEYHANTVVSAKPPKRPSMKERKQKLLAFLQGTFFLLGLYFYDGFLSFIEPITGFLSLKLLILIFVVTEKYEPVYAKWTTERCAVCRWVEDWDYNKIIICNRYCQGW